MVVVPGPLIILDGDERPVADVVVVLAAGLLLLVGVRRAAAGMGGFLLVGVLCVVDMLA